MPIRTVERAEFKFLAPIADIKCARAGNGRWTFRGHAAVFNRPSHDLGGFRTVIAPTFFDNVLPQDPPVHLVWDHDTRWVLGYTRNGSLELTVNERGLQTFAMFPETATAEECATLLAGGYIDQMSFATDIGEDEWTEDEHGITRTLHTSAGLYDVTICAQGAFPQTDAQLVASVHDAGTILASAKEAGRVTRREQDPDLVAAAGQGEKQEGVARASAGAEGVAEAHGPEGTDAAAESHRARLAALKERAAARYAQSRAS